MNLAGESFFTQILDKRAKLSHNGGYLIVEKR